MIQDYLNHLNNGSTVYKLKPYGEELLSAASLSFLTGRTLARQLLTNSLGIAYNLKNLKVTFLKALF